MTIPEIISTGRDFVLTIAAAITATVAIIGIKSWSRELRGRADFDTARGLARATYRLRDEIGICRSPFIRANEFPASYPGSDKTPPQEEAEAWAHVYKNRWEPVWKALQEFDAQALEAESLWPQAIRIKTDALRACVRELNGGIEATIENKAMSGRNFESDQEFGKKIRAIVSASGSDKTNDLSKNIAIAVAGIEEQLRPHLKRS